MEGLDMSSRALPWGVGVWFSSWYVVSINPGHIGQSPQSAGPRWSLAFKLEPVLFPPSPSALFCVSRHSLGEGNGTPLQYSCLKLPWTGEPGGLPSMGSHRVGHDWSDLAEAAVIDISYCLYIHWNYLSQIWGRNQQWYWKQNWQILNILLQN